MSSKSARGGDVEGRGFKEEVKEDDIYLKFGGKVEKPTDRQPDIMVYRKVTLPKKILNQCIFFL